MERFATERFAVKRIALTARDGEPVRLGGGYYGSVYLGRLHPESGKPKRVAVKIFRQPIDNERANQYSRIIGDLRAAGVPLPKMGFHQLTGADTVHGLARPGQWIQVSQLFGSTGKTKLLDREKVETSLPEDLLRQKVEEHGFWYPYLGMTHESPGAKRDAVEIFTKMANAGYLATIPDVTAALSNRKGAIPIDLDMVVQHKPARRAETLVTYINSLSNDAPERRALFQFAFKNANEEMRAALKRTGTIQ